VSSRGTQDLVTRLARVNRVVVLVVALALALAGFFLPGLAGGLVLLVLAAALGTLLALTWPVQPPTRRLLRLLVLAALVAFAGTKIF